MPAIAVKPKSLTFGSLFGRMRVTILSFVFYSPLGFVGWHDTLRMFQQRPEGAFAFVRLVWYVSGHNSENNVGAQLEKYPGLENFVACFHENSGSATGTVTQTTLTLKTGRQFAVHVRALNHLETVRSERYS